MPSTKIADRFGVVVAVTLREPMKLLAVTKGVVIVPCELVVPVKVRPPPANVPEGPLEGSVKVTEALGTPAPLISKTRATSALPNCWLGATDWPEPETAVIPTEATMLVKLNLAVRA